MEGISGIPSSGDLEDVRGLKSKQFERRAHSSEVAVLFPFLIRRLGRDCKEFYFSFAEFTTPVMRERK